MTTAPLSNSLYQLKNRSIDLNLRGFHNHKKASIDEYSKDYLRQIGIYLKGNYNIKRISCKSNHGASTNTRRSSRNTNTNRSMQPNEALSDSSINNEIGSILTGYVRCYLEDYMALKEKSSIRVLCPSDQILFEAHEPIHQVQLSSSKFNVFDCIIDTAPNYEWVNQSLTYTDIKHALTRGNYGSYIQVTDDRSKTNRGESVLLTWREVLLGKSTGVQVWRQQTTFRDMIDMFKNKRKNKNNMMQLLNSLHDEIYGDRIQLYHLIHCYYRINLQENTSNMKEMTTLINTFEPIVLHGNKFTDLIHTIDNVFKVAIDKSFHTFTSINSPLIDDTQVRSLIELYRDSLPNHYHIMKMMYSYQKKENLIKNMHLKKYDHYDRLLFHQFLSQSRILNSHNLVHFSMISTGASYGQGVSSNGLIHLTSSGLSCTYKTMMKKN